MVRLASGYVEACPPCLSCPWAACCPAFPSGVPAAVVAADLLQFLLFLLVFLLELLELLLLPLVDLLPSTLVSVPLLSLLLLLDLFLFDLLALLVLSLAKLYILLPLLLIELRAHRRHRVGAVRPRTSRTVAIGPVASIVWGRIPGVIALGWLPTAVGSRRAGSNYPARCAAAGRRYREPWAYSDISHIGLRLAGIAGRRRPVRIILHVARRLAGVIGSRGPIRIISHIGLRLAGIAGRGRPVRIILHVARRLAGVVVGSNRPVGIILIIPLLLPLAVSVVVLLLAGPRIALAVLWRPGCGRRRHSDVRARLCVVAGPLLTHLRNGRRPAAIGFNLLLLLYEGNRGCGGGVLATTARS